MNKRADNLKDTVKVAIRIRPLIQRESEAGYQECIDVVHGEPRVFIKDLGFTFDFVCPQHMDQQDFYDTAVKGLISKFMQGYNITILAYGQTGSGKTYTMGTDYSGSNGDPTQLGVIPKAAADIFNFINYSMDEFIIGVNVSFMELYQDLCYDLLSGKDREQSIIEIREDINKRVVLPGLTELSVTSLAETMAVLQRGLSGRVTGSTEMNRASSRSHAIFTIHLHKQSKTDKNIATSKFHLVDLAGSERAKKTKATGERLKESVKINQGLLALGKVISALRSGMNRSFVSYRDSKLTRLLQDSLGGYSFTLMVACVSPADYDLEETLSTLRYASCARQIHIKPVINRDARSAEIARLNDMLNQLRLQLLSKLPSVNEPNNEQLHLELKKEKTRYRELLIKHKDLAEHLENLLLQNTSFYEINILAEEAKFKIEKKLNEIAEKCNQAVETLSTTDQPHATSALDYMKDIQCGLEELRSVNTKTNEQLIEHEIKQSFVKEESDPDKVDDEVLLNEDQVITEEEKQAIAQALALNQEWKDLNRAMAIKASMVQAILATNKKLLESHQYLRDHQEQDLLDQLERERDRLMQQLEMNKSKNPSHEECRNKVSGLEAEISKIKTKYQAQGHILRLKKENEAKIDGLNAEFQKLRAAKAKLVRRMREESEKLLRPRSAFRERARAVARMESLRAEQQGALRRKMAAAVAVNTRLRNALEKRKKTHVKRTTKGRLEAGGIQQHVEQELEVTLSIVDAEKSLEELMEYRAWITEKIDGLRREGGDRHGAQILELEEDLKFRKAQISSMQQDILAADQELISRTRFADIQSMHEAKVALKCVFELLVDAKRELHSQSEKGYRARYDELKQAYDRLTVERDVTKTEFQRQIAKLKRRSESNVAALVALQRGVVPADGRGQASQHLQDLIADQQQRLDRCEAEKTDLPAPASCLH